MLRFDHTRPPFQLDSHVPASLNDLTAATPPGKAEGRNGARADVTEPPSLRAAAAAAEEARCGRWRCLRCVHGGSGA